MTLMTDLLHVLTGIGFFLLCALFAWACEKV